jgi:hypothetical protein
MLEDRNEHSDERQSPMNQLLRRFKRLVHQAMDETDFRPHGLAALFLDAGPDPSPQQLAALAAHYFCTEDGYYNGSEPGMDVVLLFLVETCTSLAPTEHIKSKLKSLLEQGATVAELSNWFSGFYKP